MAMYNEVKQECLNNPQVMGIEDICTATTDDFNSVQQCVEKKFVPEIVSTVLFFEYPTQLSGLQPKYVPFPAISFLEKHCESLSLNAVQTADN
jgi:hypothetical protein